MNPVHKKQTLGNFERYLIIWIPLCMITGIVLSLYTKLGGYIEALAVGGISIPIGICLFFMMYPAVLNLKSAELKKTQR